MVCCDGKDSQNGGEDSVESLLARGRALELSQNHSEAVDLYLQLDSSLLADFDKLQEVGNHSTWGQCLLVFSTIIVPSLYYHLVASFLLPVRSDNAPPKFRSDITAMTSLEFQVWGLAISVAKEHVVKRLPEVVSTVTGRLRDMERYEAAGELYEDINAMKEVSTHAYWDFNSHYYYLNSGLDFVHQRAGNYIASC
jgi:hypothetical protein